jgi:hypothetical protein
MTVVSNSTVNQENVDAALRKYRPTTPGQER